MTFDIFIPLFIASSVTLALIKKAPVFDSFTAGAAQGLKTLYTLAPTLVGLIVAVNMFKSSGAADLICDAASPVCAALGFPKEIVPMVILRPISGGGSTALLTEVFKESGPDSFPGEVASVLAGSTETTFYAIAVYFGSAGIKKIRHTLFAALAADFTAAVMAAVTVRLLLN